MSDSSSSLQIIFPDFFNLVAEHDPEKTSDAFPFLMRLLNRGQVFENPQQTLIHEVLSIFGWDSQSSVLPNLTGPTAALDGIPYTTGLYRADPVHLRADGMQLRLFSGQHVAPTQTEADKLIDELNQQFPECEFLCGRDPSRWYVRFPEALDFVAQTPFQMHQQIIDDELPTGQSAKQIHALLNEFQMMMHQSEINHLRELNGRPVLNSVWIWGGGEKFTGRAEPHLRLYGGDFLTLALAKQCGIDSLATSRLLQNIDSLSDATRKVIFLNDSSSTSSKDNKEIGLFEFESSWCELLVNHLKRGNLKRLQIVDNYRRLEITNLDVWKVWRRTSYFSDRLTIELDPQKISADVLP